MLRNCSNYPNTYLALGLVAAHHSAVLCPEPVRSAAVGEPPEDPARVNVRAQFNRGERGNNQFVSYFYWHSLALILFNAYNWKMVALIL